MFERYIWKESPIFILEFANVNIIYVTPGMIYSIFIFQGWALPERRFWMISTWQRRIAWIRESWILPISPAAPYTTLQYNIHPKIDRLSTVLICSTPSRLASDMGAIIQFRNTQCSNSKWHLALHIIAVCWAHGCRGQWRFTSAGYQHLTGMMGCYRNAGTWQP